MTALRRSSMSFRRQGSSGLIWEDKIQVVEKKPTLKVTVSINKSDGEEHPNPDEGSRERRDADSHSPPDSSIRSKPDQSVHKCSFSTVFGRCMRPPCTSGKMKLSIISVRIKQQLSDTISGFKWRGGNETRRRSSSRRRRGEDSGSCSDL